ncbi:MAG: hypothetical protein QM817_29520 [Archangium sp.]
MKTKWGAAALVISMFSACPQMPGPDGGTGGGTGGGVTGGGGTTGGGTTGGGTGGGGGGGGTGGGMGGGSSGPFDAGRLNCTFETPFLLGDGDTGYVAVTASGEAIYAWSETGNGLHYVVQSPAGVLGTVQNDATGGLPAGYSLAANGDRALLVSTSTAPAVQARRFTTGGSWSAPESLMPTPQTLAGVFVGLEPNGAASVWRQDSFNTSPWIEVASDGTTFGAPHEVSDAGFLYSARRANGTRVAVTLQSFTGVLPEVVVSTAAGDTRTTLTGSVVTGNDYFHSAVADDGTVVIAGTFNLSGTDGVGAMVRSGGTFGAAQMVSVYADGGMSSVRTIGAVAGPGGLGAVAWLNEDTVFLSHRTGTTWSAPQIIASAGGVVPRFTQLNASRGLVHVYDSMGMPKFIEFAADGYVSALRDTPLSGATFGTEFAGQGSKAAAISTATGLDGGYVIYASQCR